MTTDNTFRPNKTIIKISRYEIIYVKLSTTKSIIKWDLILYIENEILYNITFMSDVMLVESTYTSIQSLWNIAKIVTKLMWETTRY